jgi:hypothetical protein
MLRALPSIQEQPSSLSCRAYRPGRGADAAGTAGTDLVGGGSSRGARSNRLATQPLGRTFPGVTAFCISQVNIWEKSHVSAH